MIASRNILTYSNLLERPFILFPSPYPPSYQGKNPSRSTHQTRPIHVHERGFRKRWKQQEYTSIGRIHKARSIDKRTPTTHFEWTPACSVGMAETEEESE